MRPPIRRTVLTVHIIASVALLGEVWGLVVLNSAAALTNDPALAHAAYRLMPNLVFAGGIPLSLTALATGITLGLGSHWGLFRYYWVTVKLGLLVAVICIGMFLFDPEGMAATTQGGAVAAASVQWSQTAVVGAQCVMLVVATVLSVFKPRWRLRWSPAPSAPRPTETSTLWPLAAPTTDDDCASSHDEPPPPVHRPAGAPHRQA